MAGMELFSKIRLSKRFGKMIYLISGILSLSLASVVVLSPPSIPLCFIVKMLSIPVIHYLNMSMSKGFGIYFYLNLGISRREYYVIPFVMDFISFVLLMVVSGLIGYAVR